MTNKCKSHNYKTIVTVPGKATAEKKKRLNQLFEIAERNGVKVTTARKHKCANEGCEKERLTVEISVKQFEKMLRHLDTEGFKSDGGKHLSPHAEMLSQYLKDVAARKQETRHSGLAMYKEAYTALYPEREWNTSCKDEVVRLAGEVSNYEEYPLNLLIVNGNTKKPGVSLEDWEDKKFFEKKFKDYDCKTVEDFQKRCWDHYGKNNSN